MAFVGVGAPSLTVQPRPSGGGGIPPGSPNAIVYYDPAGLTITTNANLTAFPVDQFGRPQILDRRLNGFTGCVFRQGAWTADGDPSDIISEGVVLYGPAPNGLFNANNGTIGRSKYSRFAIRMIQNGVDIGYAFRVDADNAATVWDNLTVFGLGALVQYEGTYYTSLQAGNVGNVPPTPPALSAWWLQTDTAGGLYVKDNAGQKTFLVNRNTGDVRTSGDVLPTVTGSGNIGTDSYKFARVRATNIVAGDLHLKDEERNAHWVIREETDRIVITNKITGKRYAMALVPLEEEEE